WSRTSKAEERSRKSITTHFWLSRAVFTRSQKSIKFSTDTAAIIAEITPNYPEAPPSKKRRFSPTQWMLHSCCDIATTDDTDELFHTQNHLATQVETLQLAVHNDHRNILQSVSTMEDLTRQFNTITGEAKHALASTILQSHNLEEREVQITKHIIQIYNHLDTLAKKTKLAIAASACQTNQIPSQIVTPPILKGDLIKIQESLPDGWELAVPYSSLGKYYTMPISSCIFSNQQVAVMIRVPITRSSLNLKLYSAKPIYYRDFNQTCSKSTPGTKLISSGRDKNFHWIEDDMHCQPERDAMCYVGRDLLADTPTDLECKDCITTCSNSSATRVTAKSGDTFAISNPPTSITITCGGGKNSTVLNVPTISHGYIELILPCSCEAEMGSRRIGTSFPCEASWGKQVSISHIIPAHWVPENETSSIAALLANGTMAYQEKLTSVLNATWEITQKPMWISQEVTTPPMSAYHKFKKAAMGFHLEWSVVITILIFIIILRKPINLLLMKMIDAGTSRSEARLEQVILKHEINIKRLESRLTSTMPPPMPDT
ncbi:hypothetical protein WDU94_003723, partial [Cyamophila willieti]